MIINSTAKRKGGLASQILVTAASGSTVTCTTPDGIVLTVVESAGTWLFSKLTKTGVYTITATKPDGTETKTKTVTIDAVAIYRVVIAYKMYLYKDGDLCTDITGGWTFTKTHPSYSNSGITYHDSPELYLYTNQGSNQRIGGWVTDNYIDMSAYSTINFKVNYEPITSASYGPSATVGLYDGAGNINDRSVQLGIQLTQGTGGYVTRTYDLTSMAAAPICRAVVNMVRNGTLYVTQIWLD